MTASPPYDSWLICPGTLVPCPYNLLQSGESTKTQKPVSDLYNYTEAALTAYAGMVIVRRSGGVPQESDAPSQ
ncbi:MAG: hypothetical protein WBR18_03705 [Anaerolineales bacterium]